MKINNKRNQLQYDKTMFFGALLLSAFGYEFVFFVMTVHIYDISKSAFSIGVFTTLTIIPKFLSSLIGSVADKLGKARCFAAASGVIAVLLLLLMQIDRLLYIYLIWFLLSLFFTVIINTRGSLVAEIVTRDSYTSGNSIALSLLNGAKLLGPLFGGMLARIHKENLLFWIAVITYLVVGLCAVQIKSQNRSVVEKSRIIDNMIRGFAFIQKNKIHLFLTQVALLWRLLFGFQVTIFVVYIKSYLGCDASEYGVFLTIVGVGSILGSVIAPLIGKHVKNRMTIVVGLGLHYLSFIALAFCHSYVFSLIIVLVSFAGFYLSLVTLHSIRDREAPSGIRSSAYGTVTAILAFPGVLSMLIGSYLVDYVSITSILFFSGALALLSLVVLIAINRETVKCI